MWGLEGGKNLGVGMTRNRFSAGGEGGPGGRLYTAAARRKPLPRIDLRFPLSTLAGNRTSLRFRKVPFFPGDSMVCISTLHTRTLCPGCIKKRPAPGFPRAGRERFLPPVVFR